MPRCSLVLRAALCCVTSALILAPTPARAAGTSSKVTFSGVVQLPGVLLSPGTYEFRGNTGDKFVKVIDKRGQVVAHVGVLATTRPTTGDIVTLRPSMGGNTPEVSAWYPTGGTTGVEFVYRRKAAKSTTVGQTAAGNK